ncbi:hypothetical protein NKH77_48365 [Streptomyces sp. M19]
MPLPRRPRRRPLLGEPAHRHRVHHLPDPGAAGRRRVPRAVREDPAFVPAAGILEGTELFDADFFGISAGKPT